MRSKDPMLSNQGYIIVTRVADSFLRIIAGGCRFSSIELSGVCQYVILTAGCEICGEREQSLIIILFSILMFRSKLNV